MKKIIALFIATFFSAVLFSTSALAASSIKAKVNGMVCAFCAKGIEKKLKALPQSQAVFVDLKSQVVALELKEGQSVPLDQFKQIIKDAGYEVSEAAVVSQSVQEIKAGIAE
jgi:copper chaperone CopZ